MKVQQLKVHGSDLSRLGVDVHGVCGSVRPGGGSAGCCVGANSFLKMFILNGCEISVSGASPSANPHFLAPHKYPALYQSHLIAPQSPLLDFLRPGQLEKDFPFQTRDYGDLFYLFPHNPRPKRNFPYALDQLDLPLEWDLPSPPD